MRRWLIVTAVTVCLLAGCGGGTEPAEPTHGVTAAEGQDSPPTPVPTDLPADCEDGPDRTVTPLEPVTIPEVHVPEQVVEDQQVGGEAIPGFVVPEIYLPEQVVDAGCIIEFSAPGACLGQVVITELAIPELVFPGFEIPPVTTGEREVPYQGTTVEGSTVGPILIDGVQQDEVCQREPSEDSSYVAAVHRPALNRPAGNRPAVNRPAAHRPSICVDGECTDAVAVPGVSVPPLSVPPVSFPPASLAGYQLEDTDAEVYEDDGRTAYLAPADVLFEFDQSALNDDAIPTLEAIAAAIDETFGGEDVTILVEGHTDSVGEARYNQRLSEERATTVATWLTEVGGLDPTQVSTVGYGDTVPVAPNEHEDGSDNPEGRAQNRRVVITVASD